MIIGKIHPGSGLGDQLFSYIITRVIALDKGYEFGFVGKEFFKGKDFMQLDWGKKVSLGYDIEQPSGRLIMFDPNKVLPEFVFDKPYYDPEVNFIEDGTIIDGYGAQDERYWGHRLNEIREWLKVEPLKISNDKVILNFRGGEYATIPDLFLPKEYWNIAIDKFSSKFEKQIHTDDPERAKWFLFNFDTVSDIKLNWRSLRYAKNAIISNSAFAIIPRLLKHLEDPEAVTIAPFGWNARNASLTEWKGRPQNYYSKFTYI